MDPTSVLIDTLIRNKDSLGGNKSQSINQNIDKTDGITHHKHKHLSPLHIILHYHDI